MIQVKQFTFPDTKKILVPLLALLLSTGTACQAQVDQKAAATYTTKPPTPGGTGKVYMGREIAHVMGAGGGEWLDRSTRLKEENSMLVIENMMLDSNSVVADIGAGTGFYTFKVAAEIPDGRVYAVELQDAFVLELKKRRQQMGLHQVEVVQGSTRSIPVPDASLDLAFMVDVYHELAYPQELLQAIHRALKPGGKLLLVEYRAEDPNLPIQKLHKMTVEQVKKELEANSFELYKRVDMLPIQHFLMFTKAEAQ